MKPNYSENIIASSLMRMEIRRKQTEWNIHVFQIWHGYKKSYRKCKSQTFVRTKVAYSTVKTFHTHFFPGVRFFTKLLIFLFLIKKVKKILNFVWTNYIHLICSFRMTSIWSGTWQCKLTNPQKISKDIQTIFLLV